MSTSTATSSTTASEAAPKTGTTPATTPMMAQIEAMVKDVPGWTPIDQLYTLFTMGLMTAGLRGDIVEIGSWCGRSSAVLGLAARLTGNTKVLCIDLFPERNDWKENADGSYSMELTINGKRYAGYQDQTVWKEPWEKYFVDLYARYPKIFDAFTETITNNGLNDLVESHRGDSDVLQQRPVNSCRLAFLDGDHSYDAVCKDIRNVDRVLVPGGWMCFDDAFSYYDGVNQAITDLVINNPGYELGQQMTRKLFVARKKIS